MALSLNEILINIAGRNEDARSAIQGVRREIEKVPNTTKKKVQVEVKKALIELQGLSEELRKIDREKVEPRIAVEVTRQLAQIETFKAALRAIPNEKNLRLDLKGNLLQRLANVEKGILNIGPSLSQTQAATTSFTTAVGRTLSGLRALGPIVQGTSIALIGVLVPALFAVASAAAAAAAGIGLLATALLGAIGPAVAVAGAALGRFTKILDARKAAEAAKQAAAADGLTTEQRAAKIAEERRKREVAVSDALRGTQQAERDLAAARENAQQGINDANQRVEDAHRDVARAAEQVERATVDAYRAMEDAIEAASDAVRDLRSAQLDAKQSKLDLRQAELDLKKFREEAGLAGASLDGMFRKFTDVDFDPKGAKGLLASVGANVGAEEDQLRLEQLILNVQKAREGEKDATDGVSDAQRTLNRARETEREFLKNGIAAYEGLTAAIDQQASATRTLAAANRDAARVNAAGVENSPAVVAAIEAQRDAEERLRAARAARNAPSDDPVTRALDEAKRKYGELSKAERLFSEQLDKTGQFLSGFFRPITDQVFGGLAKVLALLPVLLEPMRGAFQELGKAMGESFADFAKVLMQPAVIQGLVDMVKASADLVKILGGPVFGNLLVIFLNLAQAAMPALIDLLTRLGEKLGGLAKKSEGLSSTSNFVQTAIAAFEAFLDLGAAVAELFVTLITVVGPFGTMLVKGLTGAIRSFAKFGKSAKGSKKIRQFFEDVLPFIKEFGKTLGLVFTIFLDVFQFIAPALTGLLKALNFFLTIIKAITGALTALTSNPVGRFFKELLGTLFGFGFISRIVRSFFGFLKNLPVFLGAAKKFLAGFFSPLTTAVRAVVRFIKRGPGGIADAIKSAVSGGARAVATGAVALFNAAKKIPGKVVDGIKTGATAVFRVGLSIIKWVWDGIKSYYGTLWKLARGIVARIVSAVRSAFNFVTKVGRDMLDGLVKGFTTIGKAVYNAIKGLARKIVDAVKKVLGIKSPSKVMEELGQFMLKGLIKGFTSGNVVSFIKEHLGGIAALAAKLAVSKSPLGIVVQGVEDLTGIDVPWLAKGGILTGPTLIGGGERGREAVLPLTRSVFDAIGRAIAQNMRIPSFDSPRPPQAAFSGALAGVSATNNYNLTLPPAPAAQVPDARYQASQLAMMLRRKGMG